MKCLALAAMAVLLLPGCFGTSAYLPAETLVKRVRTEIKSDGTRVEETTESQAKGAGAKGENIQSFSAGDVMAGWDGANAGASALKMFQQLSGMKTVYIIGAGLIAFGVLVGFLASWKLGIALAAAGGAVMAAGATVERYPWIGLLAALVCAGAALALAIALRRGGQNGTALKTIVGAVERCSPASAEEVKGLVETHAELQGNASTVKATVQAMKKK